jgi:hypothetical protein
MKKGVFLVFLITFWVRELFQQFRINKGEKKMRTKILLIGMLISIILFPALALSEPWNITTIDSTGNGCTNVDLTLDSNNHIHISYYDYTNGLTCPQSLYHTQSST